MASSPELLQHHRSMLETESGVPARLVDGRGYYTETTKAGLRRLGYGDAQQLAPALVIPLFNPDGTVGGSQIRPDSPRAQKDKPDKFNKYETPTGQRNVLDVHPLARARLLDPAIPLIITEGVKKADAMFGAWNMPVVALTGVYNWRGKNDASGVTALDAWQDIPLKGKDGSRTVYIAFDSDISTNPNVKRAAETLASYLASKGAHVRYFAFPSEDGRKVGGDDYVVSGGSHLALIQTATDYPPGWAPTERTASGRPAIVINNRNLDDKIRDAIAALNLCEPPLWFVRDQDYVRVGESRDGAPIIERHTPGTMQVALATAATWLVDAGEDKPPKLSSPPKDVFEGVLNTPSPSPKTPLLSGIARCPVAIGDHVVTGSGYHRPSGWFVQHRINVLPWDDTPAAAVEYFTREVLCDFPFVDQASRAHAIALWLLPYVRPLITGPTPLHFIDAPTAGSGKSKLAKACLYSSLGHNVEISKIAHTDEEFDKELFALLLEGHPAIILDNLGRKMASSELAAVLTTNRIRGRILGSTATKAATVNATFAMTSNNGALSPDIARRSIWIRIDPMTENPEDRTGFRHENLDQWVIEHQGILTGAAIAIVSAWIKAGKPGCPLTKGSFESWVDTLGGILSVAGVDGFLANEEQLKRQTVVDTTEWNQFYQFWWQIYGRNPVTAGDLRDICVQNDLLLSVIGDKGEKSQTTRLGGALRKQLNRVFGGLRSEDAGVQLGRTRLRLEVVEKTAPDKPQLPVTNQEAFTQFKTTPQIEGEEL